MARRDFGSLRQRGRRWQVRYPDPSGGSRSRTFATRADGARFLALIRADIERGGWFDPGAGSQTLTEYSSSWIPRRRVRGRPLAPQTRELYDRLLRNHILPALGTRQLRHLDPLTVRGWHRDLTGAAGPGAVTAAKCYRLLHAICATAVGEGELAHNPCTIRGASVEHNPERPVIGIPIVYAIAEAVGLRWRAMVLLAAFCGLRFGELAALTRADLDVDTRSVTVRASVAELQGGVREIGGPKSDAGRRTVAIPEAIISDITAHLDEFVEPDAAATLFRGPKGGKLRRATFGHSVWRPAVCTVGVPGLHFHDLRHTGATLAAATGASTAELMRRLGHASPDAALRYQHATRDRDVVIANALSDMIGQYRSSSGESDRQSGRRIRMR